MNQTRNCWDRKRGRQWHITEQEPHNTFAIYVHCTKYIRTSRYLWYGSINLYPKSSTMIMLWRKSNFNIYTVGFERPARPDRFNALQSVHVSIPSHICHNSHVVCDAKPRQRLRARKCKPKKLGPLFVFDVLLLLISYTYQQ